LYRLFDLEKIEGQSAYLFYFIDTVTNYLRDNSADIHTFIDFWEEELCKKTIPTGDGIAGVRAMTIHKSKGLQFHTVLIPYCTWGLGPKNPIVWCGRKDGFYDLELLPVNHSDKMNGTIFSEEYQYETSLSWLDNLNLLYVAFTRAEQNLIVFGKYKKKLATLEDVVTVSDLLQETVPEIAGKWDTESLHYESGILAKNEKQKDKEQDNLLKQTPLPRYVQFVSESFQTGKSIFKQSNQSRDFIHPDSPSKEKYVAYGNIMHALFAGIRTLNDIEKSVEKLISEGLILPAEKSDYILKVQSAIRDSGVEDWFSEKYKVYSEFSIIVKEDGEITTKRPDRVLLSENATLVIDYKFGEPHRSHEKQVNEYVSLLRDMNYPDVEGYIWYIHLQGNELRQVVS
jgi:ATP-dependent exoDNAse (exonuclease V) beta subunit